MNRRFFDLPENSTMAARNAFRYANILVGAVALVLPVVIYLSFRTGTWQLWAATASIFSIFIDFLISRRLIQNGNIKRGTQALLYGILFGIIAIPLFITNLGIMLGLTAVVLTVLVASQTIGRSEGLIIISFVAAAISTLLDLFLPPYRLTVPELQVFTPIITGTVVVVLGFMTFRTFKNLSLLSKILLLAITSVLITALTLIASIVWQSSQFNDLAQEQLAQSVDADLIHITEGVYNMVKAQDELVEEMVNYSLNVARRVLDDTGQVSLSEEKVSWTATNQFTQQPIAVYLPKLFVGDQWLGQNINFSGKTPVVDEVQSLMGGTATIFQRMNGPGDMLRVATNVETTDGQRAIGTYIPAIMPDGTSNPVVSTVLSGHTYRGSAFVVNTGYDTAYEPILDEGGHIIGMLYVGVKQQSVETLREAILRTRVGETGYVYVLGSEGNDRGRYIISQNGQHDGQNIWEAQDSQGNYVIQTIIDKALMLKAGETALVRYQWQDPGDEEPRWKIARIAYYEPWHWVIASSIYEDELAAYHDRLQEGQNRMVKISGAIGILIALVMGFLSILMARSISRPVDHLANVATQIAAGNMEMTAEVKQQDEVGVLAQAFNNMTAQLKKTMDGLRDRTHALTVSTEVSHRISTILNERELIIEVVEQLKAAFSYYHAHIYLLDETNGDLIMAGGTGDVGASLLGSGHKIPKGKGLVGRSIEMGTPILVEDVSREPGWLPNPLLPETKSEIAVPIFLGSQIMGVLDVQHNEIGGLKQQDVDLLQAIANPVAIALQNARSYTVLQQRAERETRITAIGQKIQSTTTVEGALQVAARELGRTLNLNEIRVILEAPGWAEGSRSTKQVNS